MSDEKIIENGPSLPAEKPAAAVAERPAASVAERPAAPVMEKPAAPVMEKPEAAVAEKPSAVPAEVPAPEPSPEEAFEAEAAESRAEMDEPFDLPEAEIEVDIRDDRDDAAESLIRWAAARAGLIVVAPVLGTAALMANEVYMIVRLGETYGVKLSDKVVLSFIGSLGGTAAGSLAATLIPIAVMQVPIAVGVTYGIGRAAQRWIKDGMPDDVKPYREVFEEEKKAGEKNVDELKENPKKEQPLGDETVHFEEPETKKLYPDQAHEAFGRLSGRLSEAAGLASERFLDALKKAGVTDEQIEQARYMAIGVSEVAKETAVEAARDLSAQAKVKSRELAEQAKVKSKELSQQAKVKSKELSAQAKEQMEAVKEKSRKLRREADIRAAEARVRAEQAKAEARIRMAQARVKAMYMRAQAEEQAEETKARAVEVSEMVQDKVKEYKETAKKTAGEAKENLRAAAEDFRAKAAERAAERRAEDCARRDGGDTGAAAPAPENDQQPVEPKE